MFIPFFNKGATLYNLKIYFFNLTVTDNGLTIFYTTILKSFISIMILAALVTSSRDLEILSGLRKIFVPKIIVSIIFLMYRYFFLIRDEARMGQLSICTRIFQKNYYSVNKKLSYLAGTLFIKSIDRAENIYKSMESRGFNGDFEFINLERNEEYTSSNSAGNLASNIDSTSKYNYKNSSNSNSSFCNNSNSSSNSNNNSSCSSSSSNELFLRRNYNIKKKLNLESIIFLTIFFSIFITIKSLEFIYF